MDHYRTRPWTLVLRFIDCVNRGDVDAIAALLAEDYELKVFDEPAERGRDRGIDGWRGYATAFPRYLIYPQRINAVGDTVAVLGFTTGSHLGLPDDEERKLTLIWLGACRDGLLASWALIEDTPQNRERWGLGHGQEFSGRPGSSTLR